MNENKKIIYCPQCGRKTATWDGKSTIPLASRCPKCCKRVIFYPDTGEIIMKKKPLRTTGSGMVFI